MANETRRPVTWHKVADPDELPEGRVKTVSVEQAGTVTQVCLTHHKGAYR